MRVQTIARFSWKNLWAHRLRTLLTVGGVGIGIGAIVFLVSLGYGLEQLVTNQVANFEAFTIIDIPSANLKSGKINAAALDKLRAIPHVKVVEDVIDLAGRIRLASQDSTTETVVVAVGQEYFNLTDIVLLSGATFNETETDKTVINASLASLLGYESNPEALLNQELSLDMIVPEELRDNDGIEGPTVKERITVIVSGISNDASNPAMFVHKKLAQANGVINSTSVKLQVDDKEYIPETRKQIENLGYFTEYVGDTVDQITQVFSIFRLILGGFGAIALVVAGLGAFNTLTISLIERIREVSLLKMLGMKQIDVFKLFISESLTIGLLGGIVGTIVGVGAGEAADMVIKTLAGRANADAVSLFQTPTMLLAFIGIGSILVGFITGLYPAYRAIKTNPLDALRYE